MASAGAEEKTASPTAVAAPPSAGGSKLVTVLTLVNLLVTLGIVAILFISFQHEKKKASVADISITAGGAGDAGGQDEGKAGAGGATEGKNGTQKRLVDFGKMVTLEQFTVNLSTPGSVNPKFVRVNISLEVPTSDAELEVNSKMPQVRNAIIDLFNSKRPSDLATAEGREFLKEEIKNALNGFLVTGKVKGVYFTNFALAG